jgi:hypothetical protein
MEQTSHGEDAALQPLPGSDDQTTFTGGRTIFGSSSSSSGRNGDDDDDDVSTRTLLVHWRGEREVGYSKPLRQLEFRSSLEAELGLLPGPVGGHADALSVEFVNALQYTGHERMADVGVEHFNEGMQYVSVKFDNGDRSSGGTPPARRAVSRQRAVRAAERCSLVHALFEVVASSNSLEDLADLAIHDGGFSDLYEGAVNGKSTWCFRARNYHGDPSPAGDEDEMDNAGRAKRYGSRTRSMGVEREGLTALKSLLVRFGGKVDLMNPQNKIYLFDGLDGPSSKVLARRIATGPKVRLSMNERG